MAIISYTCEEQTGGRLNGGDVFEKKPIGFPEDDGLLRAYSNLFYWSHMWTETGGEITEQTYEGFEILTFVLKGEAEHYNNKDKEWKKLSAGDLQVIRAGKGIVHPERLMPSSSMIRIWTDPCLEKSLNQPSSHEDYPSYRFPVINEKGRSEKIYLGTGSPVRLQTEGLAVKEVSMAGGKYYYKCRREVFVSGFVIEGDVMIRKHSLHPHDFFIAKEEEGFDVDAITECRILIVESPLEPSYTTYADKYKM